MLKNIVSIAIIASLCSVGCKSKADKPKEATEASMQENDAPKVAEEPVASNPEVREAAIGYCDCFNQNFKKVDPKIQAIFITAAESSDPLMVLQKEIFSITDPAEQQRLGEEMQKLWNSGEMEACAKKLEQKYRINENDRATQRQILQALEGNEECKLVAALMRIGLKQAEMAPMGTPVQ